MNSFSQQEREDEQQSQTWHQQEAEAPNPFVLEVTCEYGFESRGVDFTGLQGNV